MARVVISWREGRWGAAGGKSWMVRARCLLAVLALGLSLSVSAASASQPQLNEEAALVIEGLPTADPCVVSSMVVDVLDFVPPLQSDQMYFGLSSTNICTGESVASVSPLPSDPWALIGESAFRISSGHDVGDLTVTLPAFDYVTQSETSVTFNLRWESARGVSDPAVRVTGTASSGDLTVVLDDSITWNRWGSELGYPWAGMWPCRFAGPNNRPGCIGQ